MLFKNPITYLPETKKLYPATIKDLESVFASGFDFSTFFECAVLSEFTFDFESILVSFDLVLSTFYDF